MIYAGCEVSEPRRALSILCILCILFILSGLNPKGEQHLTGKTHMAISAATVAVLLAVAKTASRTSTETPNSLSVDHSAPTPSAYTAVGLLVLGIFAGLFPDLDAPDSELQHLPGRLARRAGWCIGEIGASTHKRSPQRTLAIAAQGLVRLASLPFTFLLLGVSTALRAFTVHRGFTHTLWGALVFTGLAAAVAMLLTGSVHWTANIGAVWLLGYASHLAADACTPSGIPLFGGSNGSGASRDNRASARTSASQAQTLSLARRPRTGRANAFHLLPERMLIRTGTLADTLLVRWVSWVMFLAAATALFLD